MTREFRAHDCALSMWPAVSAVAGEAPIHIAVRPGGWGQNKLNAQRRAQESGCAVLPLLPRPNEDPGRGAAVLHDVAKLQSCKAQLPGGGWAEQRRER